VHGYSDGNALCPAKFEHTLYILAKEWCFNGQFVGLMILDELIHGVMNESKPFKHVFHLCEFDAIHCDQRQFPAIHFQKAVTHHLGPRVDA
jgi:hypothetical protein